MERRDETGGSVGGRSAWPVRSHPIDNPPSEDLSGTTSAAERLAMMWPLTLEAWRLAGLPIPAGPRTELPSRLLRGGQAR